MSHYHLARLLTTAGHVAHVHTGTMDPGQTAVCLIARLVLHVVLARTT